MIQDHLDHGASKEPMNPRGVGKDFSVPLMHHDPSDLGSVILFRIIPKERTLTTSLFIDYGTAVAVVKLRLQALDFIIHRQRHCGTRSSMFCDFFRFFAIFAKIATGLGDLSSLAFESFAIFAIFRNFRKNR